MVGTVSLNESGIPVWYEQACEVLGNNSKTAKADALSTETALSPRTTQRFVRLASFLQENYPELLKPEQPMCAGSAAILELTKIHGISKSEADTLAPRVLNGEIGVVELRQRVDRIQREAAGEPGLARKRGNQRAAAFEEIASELILSGAVKLPVALEVVKIMRPERREPMAPDLIAFGKEPGQVIAIEIKAPSDRSSRSPFHMATELMERMALLKLHFSDAVLVLPKEASEVALLAQNRWEVWVKNLPPESRKMHILFVDNNH